MKEFYDIAQWLESSEPHALKTVDTLPSPTFQANGRTEVSFSTNNYLALSSSDRLISAARKGLEQYGVGNCESRLLGGNLGIYEALERKIAKQKSAQSAMLFATGYLTNLGVLSSLPRAGQYARIYGYRSKGKHTYEYFSDEFNHLSIREGIRMSGAHQSRFRHADLDHLEELLKKSAADCRIIVTDGVFSQDGDIADLPGMLALAERYDSMVYVDDAHGTGVLGPNGGGITEHFGVKSQRLIHMGTLSKAYGAIGGYIATDAAIAEILRLSCAAYGFTSTLPPDQAFAVSEAMDAVEDEPQRRQRLWDNQRYFVSRMKQLPYQLVSTTTPIVPVMVGNESLADRFADQLEAEHIHIDAVKFPAVAMGKARLRVQLNAGHSRAQIDHLVDVFLRNQDFIDGGERLSTVVNFVQPAVIQPVKRPWAQAAFVAPAQHAAALVGRMKTAFAKLGRAIAFSYSQLVPYQFNLERSLNLVAMTTAAVLAIDVIYDVPHLIFVYLLPILFVARKFGRVPAIIATMVSVVCSTFLLFEPIFSLSIEDPNDVIDTAIFSVIALSISALFSKDSVPVLREAR
jgi:8-amino-7-oxononanoate synthase